MVSANESILLPASSVKLNSYEIQVRTKTYSQQQRDSQKFIYWRFELRLRPFYCNYGWCWILQENKQKDWKEIRFLRWRENQSINFVLPIQLSHSHGHLADKTFFFLGLPKIIYSQCGGQKNGEFAFCVIIIKVYYCLVVLL